MFVRSFVPVSKCDEFFFMFFSFVLCRFASSFTVFLVVLVQSNFIILFVHIWKFSYESERVFSDSYETSDVI